jgi:hypothetical protein
MQQRGIPPLVVDWLLRFGHMRHDHRGAIVYYFDKHSRRDLELERIGAKYPNIQGKNRVR